MTDGAIETSRRDTSDDLFGPGWLDDHLDTVVEQISNWPLALQPRLTGRRAEAMLGFDLTR